VTKVNAKLGLRWPTPDCELPATGYRYTGYDVSFPSNKTVQLGQWLVDDETGIPRWKKTIDAFAVSWQMPNSGARRRKWSVRCRSAVPAARPRAHKNQRSLNKAVCPLKVMWCDVNDPSFLLPKIHHLQPRLIAPENKKFELMLMRHATAPV